ncbi:MAG: hypothetical protein K0S27_286 [Gammaproteobacteria bacterium]|jgi:hypothetical protein|nr:hypothetical protein [Gammaproteobacteria bacterium]
MFNFLYRLSDISLFVLLVCFFVGVSAVAILIIKYFLPLKLRYKDNEVIGNISSLIGIIYGVLASLMSLYLINNINMASEVVQREANAVVNIYLSSKELKLSLQKAIQTKLKKYVENVKNKEWPSMKNGELLNEEGDDLIENLTNQIIHYSQSPHANLFVARDILSEIKLLYDARQQRVNQGYSSLNVEVWVVILIGTLLLIGINYFFKAGVALHFIALGAAIIIASSMIFLLLSLDKPFQGDFAVEPEAFQSALRLISK